MLAGLLVLKTGVIMLVARRYAGSWFKSLRTGIVLSEGGEFGFALIVMLLQNRLISQDATQLLLAAITLSMVVSPFLIRHNKRIARFLLREQGPSAAAPAPVDPITDALAKREHVILCGYGRVGQNVARVIESQGFEYLAMDLDPFRVRTAREAGDPVIYGDAADERLLSTVGLEHSSAVVITFSDSDRALEIVKSIRRLHDSVPLLVRMADDTRLEEMLKAGATEVIPETLEAALMLVSHALLVLRVPMSRVVKTVGDIRRHRYSLLRSIFRSGDVEPDRRVPRPAGGTAHGRAAAGRLVHRQVDRRGARPGRRSLLQRRSPQRHRRPRPGRGHDAARGGRGGDLWHARGARACRGRAADGLSQPLPVSSLRWRL